MKRIIITLDERAQFQQKSLRQTNLPETLPHKSFIENKYKIQVLKFLCIFQQAFNALPLTVRHLFLSNRHLIRTALFQILRLKYEWKFRFGFFENLIPRKIYDLENWVISEIKISIFAELKFRHFQNSYEVLREHLTRSSRCSNLESLSQALWKFPWLSLIQDK